VYHCRPQRRQLKVLSHCPSCRCEECDVARHVLASAG
jgi:hypothetical protein